MSKKVKVRVAVDSAGRWGAAGFHEYKDSVSLNEAALDLNEKVKEYWLEAELDVPKVATVQADVVEVE